MGGSGRSLGDLDKNAFKVNPEDPADVSRKTCDEEGNALLQQLIDAVNSNGTGGGGTGGTSGVTCQKHVINLIEDQWIEVPHSFNNDVCSWRALDSNNCVIEIGFKYDPVSLKLEVCASASINNVLIVLEGEL